MKRTIGHSRAPAVHGHADHADPESVHRNGDGDARQQHQNALPDRCVEQICRQKTQTEERKQVAQSAAGIDDLQLVVAQIDQVSIEVDGNAEQSDEENAKLRRNELQLAAKDWRR